MRTKQVLMLVLSIVMRLSVNELTINRLVEKIHKKDRFNIQFDIDDNICMDPNIESNKETCTESSMVMGLHIGFLLMFGLETCVVL